MKWVRCTLLRHDSIGETACPLCPKQKNNTKLRKHVSHSGEGCLIRSTKALILLETLNRNHHHTCLATIQFTGRDCGLRCTVAAKSAIWPAMRTCHKPTLSLSFGHDAADSPPDTRTPIPGRLFWLTFANRPRFSPRDLGQQSRHNRSTLFAIGFQRGVVFVVDGSFLIGNRGVWPPKSCTPFHPAKSVLAEFPKRYRP